ncbi:MAG TPA: 50S ribosomal protein L4, partial [bacterium]
STRSPLWRGGGVIFGPHPRPMGSRLPQQIRRRALIESLKGKIRDGELRVIDGLRADAPKTKPFAGLAGTFEVARSSIIVLAGPAPALVKSLRNLARFRLCDAGSLNALDVVNADKVLVAREAFASLDRRAKESDASGD